MFLFFPSQTVNIEFTIKHLAILFNKIQSGFLLLQIRPFMFNEY